ncbi:UNVERIFIED_CONTAM: hypothetical protein FKN15_034488 [Acipenser sinensis]
MADKALAQPTPQDRSGHNWWPPNPKPRGACKLLGAECGEACPGTLHCTGDQNWEGANTVESEEGAEGGSDRSRQATTDRVEVSGREGRFAGVAAGQFAELEIGAKAGTTEKGAGKEAAEILDRQLRTEAERSGKEHRLWEPG